MQWSPANLNPLPVSGISVQQANYRHWRRIPTARTLPSRDAGETGLPAGCSSCHRPWTPMTAVDGLQQSTVNSLQQSTAFSSQHEQPSSPGSLTSCNCFFHHWHQHPNSTCQTWIHVYWQLFWHNTPSESANIYTSWNVKIAATSFSQCDQAEKTTTELVT